MLSNEATNVAQRERRTRQKQQRIDQAERTHKTAEKKEHAAKHSWQKAMREQPGNTTLINSKEKTHRKLKKEMQRCKKVWETLKEDLEKLEARRRKQGVQGQLPAVPTSPPSPEKVASPSIFAKVKANKLYLASLSSPERKLANAQIQAHEERVQDSILTKTNILKNLEGAAANREDAAANRDDAVKVEKEKNKLTGQQAVDEEFCFLSIHEEGIKKSEGVAQKKNDVEPGFEVKGQGLGIVEESEDEAVNESQDESKSEDEATGPGFEIINESESEDVSPADNGELEDEEESEESEIKMGLHPVKCEGHPTEWVTLELKNEIKEKNLQPLFSDGDHPTEWVTLEFKNEIKEKNLQPVFFKDGATEFVSLELKKRIIDEDLHPLIYEDQLIKWVPFEIINKISGGKGSINAGVPKIQLATFVRIIDFSEHELSEEMMKLPKPLKKPELSGVVQEKFLKLVEFGCDNIIDEMKLVVDLMLAADSLCMESLVDLTCAKCASLAWGTCSHESLAELTKEFSLVGFSAHLKENIEDFLEMLIY